MKVTIEQSKESINIGEDILQELNKGIDGVEAGRELWLDEAFEKSRN